MKNKSYYSFFILEIPNFLQISMIPLAVNYLFRNSLTIIITSFLIGIIMGAYVAEKETIFFGKPQHGITSIISALALAVLFGAVSIGLIQK